MFFWLLLYGHFRLRSVPVPLAACGAAALGVRVLLNCCAFAGVVLLLWTMALPVLLSAAGVWFNNWNHERAEHLGSLLGDFDVAALQEVWGAFGRDRAEQLCARAKERGLVYSARTPKWPAGLGLMSSGLLVVSRWPLLRSEYHRFSRQDLLECPVERGCLLVEVDLGDRGTAVVANVHLSTNPWKPIASWLDLQSVHAREVLKLVAEFAAAGGHQPALTVVCGDLNMEKSDERFVEWAGLAQEAGLSDCFPHCPPTFGCVDELSGEPVNRVLLCKEELGVARTLDHIFASTRPTSVGVRAFKAPSAKCAWDEVSDHRGITADFA